MEPVSGETLFAVVKRQFEELPDADRFWYQRDFRNSDLEVIENTTLAHVIYRNTNITNLYPRVFTVPPVQ